MSARNYTLIDLGVPSGFDWSEAFDVNQAGHVVGNFGRSGQYAGAFLYSQGVMRALPLPGVARAFGVNDVGSVVGDCAVGPSNAHAFLYDSAGFQDLGTLSGGANSTAYDINNSGIVVGISNSQWGDRAFLRPPGGPKWDQGTVPGANWSAAYAVNIHGTTVGDSATGEPGGAMINFFERNMQPLGNTLPGYSNCGARGVTDESSVIGVCVNPGFGTARAFYATSANPSTPGTWAMQDLGVLPGDDRSEATDISLQSGVIVGEGEGSRRRAFVYILSLRTMYDLTTLVTGATGWSLFSANAVNDRGQIVGGGFHNGQMRAYMLTPVTA
jgi:probable HAF family extracellular repeat protein